MARKSSRTSVGADQAGELLARFLRLTVEQDGEVRVMVTADANGIELDILGARRLHVPGPELQALAGIIGRTNDCIQAAYQEQVSRNSMALHDWALEGIVHGLSSVGTRPKAETRKGRDERFAIRQSEPDGDGE